MMTPKVYGPRDLREAYMMPREDAVWIMEHCADVWERERRLLEETRGMADEWERQNAILRCHLADVDKMLDSAALRPTRPKTSEIIAAVEADMHTTDGTTLGYPGVPGVNDPGSATADEREEE